MANPDGHQLVSGPIVQASLNISSHTMYSEISTAENFIQRIGRLNRFGEHESANLFSFAASNQDGATKKSRDERINSWSGYIAKQLGRSFTKADLYGLYKDYHDGPLKDSTEKAYAHDFAKSISDAALIFKSQVLSPRAMNLSSKRLDVVKPSKLSKFALRGSSLYVATVKKTFDKSLNILTTSWIGFQENDRLLLPIDAVTKHAHHYIRSMVNSLKWSSSNEVYLPIDFCNFINKKIKYITKSPASIVIIGRNSETPIVVRNTTGDSICSESDLTYFSSDDLIVGLMNQQHFPQSQEQ
jgi:hypothetical protein